MMAGAIIPASALTNPEAIQWETLMQRHDCCNHLWLWEGQFSGTAIMTHNNHVVQLGDGRRDKCVRLGGSESPQRLFS